MQFTNPIFLWALTGLSIPIGIHLLSRKEGKVIRLGSLRHLMETSTQQFRGIRLNEILLLSLRCLLIILFSLLLSGLNFNSTKTSKWALVEKGLENEQAIKTALDSLNANGYELRWLTDGFPLLQDSALVTSAKNYRSIIEQLRTGDQSDIVVFAENRIARLAGPRTSLPSHIRWISQSLPSIDYPLQAIQITKDSMDVRIAHTDENETTFDTERVGNTSVPIEVTAKKRIAITIVSDKDHRYDERIIKAGLRAIGQSFSVELTISDAVPDQLSATGDWMIWLVPGNPPNVALKKLVLKPQLSNDLIISEKQDSWIITKRLTEDVALRENLTLAIASLLIPEREALEKNAAVRDRRVIPDSIAWAAQSTGIDVAKAGIISQSANSYLLILLLIVLITERLVAYSRNQ